MLLQLIDVPHWFLINIFLRVGYSQCLEALVHCMQPGLKVNGAYYCDVLLLKQFLPDICQTQAAGDFCFPAHHACARALRCCDTRLWTSHQTNGRCILLLPPNISDLNPIEYRILIVIQDFVYQKQQGTSNVVDELWLLTE